MKNYFVSNVLDRNMKGWLPVVDNERNFFSIPLSLKLSSKDRLNFEILEGQYKTRIVRVDYSKIKPRLFSDYLKEFFFIRKEAKLILDTNTETLTVDSLYKTFRSVNCEGIEKGSYEILVPDTPHKDKMVETYYDELSMGSRFCESWFPITSGEPKGQYIHLGSYSDGCVTIMDDWNNLYLHLITSRKSNSVVGTLEVI